ncbi:MAG: ABC transporter substrate-binding protein [Thermoprotei archaeon]
MRKNHILGSAILILFLASFLAYLPAPSSAQTTVPGPTLYLYTVTSTPDTSIDQIGSFGFGENPAYGWNGLFQIYPFNTLINGTFFPDAFISYKVIPSNNTYILVMRPGMRWSNGYPLNATSFYYMFLALAAVGSPPYTIKIINSTALAIQAIPAIVGKPGIDSPSWVFGPLDGTLPIETYPPYWAPYMKVIEGNYTALQHYNTTIIRELTSFIFHGPPSQETPPKYPLVESGPYVITSVTPSEIVMTRNPYYWDEKAWPWNSVVVYQFTSTSALETYLLAGKLDFYSGTLPQSITSELPSYIKMITYPSPSGEDLVFNFQSNWVCQLPVREAIAYAINRTQVAMAADPTLTLYKPLKYPLSVPAWVYPTDFPPSVLSTLNPYNTNLAKARELMESAGYKLVNGYWYAPNGTQVTLTLLTSPPGPFDQAMLEDVVSQLNAFGLKTTLLESTNPTYTETGKGFNLYWGGWGFWITDWDMYPGVAEYDNGLGGAHIMNWLQPVYVPGVGEISFFNLAAKARTGSPNETQELTWIHGLAYIQNHYVPDLPLVQPYNELFINTHDIIWPPSTDSVFYETTILNPSRMFLYGVEQGLIHLPVTSISLSVPASTTVGKTVTILANVKTVNSWPAPATQVEFFVNGQEIGTAIANYTGVAAINYTPTSQGTFTVTAEPTINTTMTASAQFTAAVPVSVSSVTVSTSPSSVTVGTPVTLSATVTGSNGQPVTGTTVNFLVNGQIVGSAVTGSTGMATMTYTPSATGTLTVEAQSVVNPSAKSTASLTVASAPTTSSASYAIAIGVIVVIVVIALIFVLARKPKQGQQKRK